MKPRLTAALRVVWLLRRPAQAGAWQASRQQAAAARYHRAGSRGHPTGAPIPPSTPAISGMPITGTPATAGSRIQITHSGVLLEPGQHSGAARLAGRTCASIVVKLNAAALKAIVSPMIHRIRSTRLVIRRPIRDKTPTDCVPRAREPGPPESRWPLQRRRKGTAAGVIYRLRAGSGPCGGRRCRLRQAALVEGRWAGGWPGRRPPGLLVCLVTRDTGRVSPRPPVHRSPIAWDRAGASCGTR